MPGKSACSKIKDPAKRKRCLEYAGEYSKDNKAAMRSEAKSKKTSTGRY